MRRTLFKKKDKLQHKYLRLIMLSLSLPTFLVGACLYKLTFYIFSQYITAPEIMETALLPAIKKINFSLPVLFLVLFATGVAISNRLVGPVNRMIKDVKEITGGNYSKRIKLRQNDDLKPLADTINRMLDKLG